MAKQKLNIQKQGFPSVANAYNNLLGINNDNQYVNISLSLLDEIDNQPFPINEAKIEQIADSIDNVGVIEPIIVVKDGERYKILSGRHRFRACKKLGKDEIPCYIKNINADDDIARYIIIATNTDRNNEYKPSVYARAYAEQLVLMKKLGKKSTVSAIAEQNGLSRKQIYRYIRLASLIPELQNWVDDGIISIETAVEFSFLSIEKQSSLYDYTNNLEISKSDISHTLSLSAAKYMRSLELSDDDFAENIQDIVNGTFGKFTKQPVPEATQTHNWDKAESDKVEENVIENIKAKEVPETIKAETISTEDSCQPVDYYEENVSDEVDTDIENDTEYAPQGDTQKAISSMMSIYNKTPEEINDMCDSGMFNSIIQGYILLAFDEAGFEPKIKLSRLFDDYSAQDARDRYMR